MQDQPSILFLCTGNSCRSQMAESILRQLGGDKVQSFSAGSHPAGFIHALAVDAMKQLGFSMADQRSKSWDEFNNIPIDIVITLCDAAAAQVCPTWIGAPVCVHWPMPDPTYCIGMDAQRLSAAVDVANELRDRLERLLKVDLGGCSDDLLDALSALAKS